MTDEATSCAQEAGEVRVIDAEDESPRGIAQAIEQAIEKAAETELTIAGVQLNISFRGPIPPPDMLKQYEIALPGSGKWILEHAEREQKARHDHMREQHAHRSFVEKRAQWLAFGVVIVGSIASVVCSLTGHGAAAASWGFVAIAPVVTAFLRAGQGHRLEKQDRHKSQVKPENQDKHDGETPVSERTDTGS